MTANASLGLPKSKRFPPLCLPPCAFLVLMRQQSLKIAQITASLDAGAVTANRAVVREVCRNVAFGLWFSSEREFFGSSGGRAFG